MTMTSQSNRTNSEPPAKGIAVRGKLGGILLGSFRPVAVVAAFAIALASGSIAFSQVQTPTGQQIAPGRDELNRTTQQAPQRATRLMIDGDIERAPCALDSPAYGDIKVTITEAQFNNLQGVTPEELKQSYGSLLGPDRPISTICTIRDAAATVLRQKGYLAAVQVPVQRIENGVVRFEVLFAKIVAIRVRGKAGAAENTLAAYLQHLTEEKVFNRYTAERYLLLARDMPGYDVRLALKPAGGAPGELVGEISVIHTPFEANASLQNFSSRSSGRWSAAAQASAYGLLGADRLTASVSSSTDFKEQQVAQLGYETRLGGEGLVVSGNLTYAWSAPTVSDPTTGAGIDITARTLFATGEVRYPFIRTQRFSVVGAAGFDFLNQTVKFNGAPLNRDRLRVGFLRLDMDASDISERRLPRWRASGSLELRQGYDIFDASKKVSATNPVGPARGDGDNSARLIRVSAAFEYGLGKGWWVAVLPRAQYAFDPVFSFEEFSGGNFSIGRGYDPGTVTGDHGIGSSFELRLPRSQPFEKINLSVMPFTFVDAARAWQKNTTDEDTLVSIGAGLRAMLNNRFRIDGTIAVPLKSAGLQTHNHDPRFLLSVTTKLWPWEGM